MIISLGARLPAISSGGVKGPTEPSEIPDTQILLARPRVYRLTAEAVGPPFKPEAFHMPLAGLVSVALVLMRICRIWGAWVGVTH